VERQGEVPGRWCGERRGWGRRWGLSRTPPPGDPPPRAGSTGGPPTPRLCPSQPLSAAHPAPAPRPLPLAQATHRKGTASVLGPSRREARVLRVTCQAGDRADKNGVSGRCRGRGSVLRGHHVTGWEAVPRPLWRLHRVITSVQWLCMRSDSHRQDAELRAANRIAAVLP